MSSMKDNQSTSQSGRSSRRHFFPFFVLSLLAAASLVGCNRQPTTVAATATVSDPAGTYTLVSIDGKNVPCTINHEGATPTIKSGSFVINADGTCSSKMVFSMPQGPENTREVKATYTREGKTLTMKWEGAGVTTGTVDGDTFTMGNEGMTIVDRK